MPQCPVCAERIPANVRVCPHCDAKLGKSHARNDNVDDEIEDYDASPPPRRKGKKTSRTSVPTWAILLIILGGVPLLCCPVLIALLLPAVQQAQVKNNLKFIGLAEHNFHDMFNHFPPKGSHDLQAGQQPQAWMTDILPYLDQAALYNSLDVTKPRDANPVQAGFQVQIPTYLNPSLPAAQPDARGYAPAHFAGNAALITPAGGIHIRNITDGTSNTMLAATVDGGIKTWADPSNIRDASAGFGGGPNAFGTPHHNVVLVLMADGSVHAIPRSIDPAITRLLGDPRDGQQIPDLAAPNGR